MSREALPYQILLLTLTLSLGYLDSLTPDVFGPLLAVASAGLSVAAVMGLRSWASAFRNLRYRAAWVDIPLGLSIVITVLNLYYQAILDWTRGPTQFDSVSYHITRALLWSWASNFSPWRTAIWQQIGLPVAGDAMLQPTVFAGCGWLGGAWSGTILALGAAASLFVVAESYGLSARPSLVSALAFLSFPTIGLRAGELNTDIAAAFPLIAGAALFRTANSIEVAAFRFVALCGIGVAAKPYVLFAAFPVSIALFYPHILRIIRSARALVAIGLGAGCAAAVCLLSFLPVHKAFGDFYGGAGGLQHSSLTSPWSEIGRVTVANALMWSTEPFGVLPIGFREKVFAVLHFKDVYVSVGLNEAWFPKLEPDFSRSGILALACLPWLIWGVPKKHRWSTTVLFLALFLSVTSTISGNFSMPRFAVAVLALFAVLWGYRAATYPLLVGLLVTASAAVSLDYLRAHQITSLVPAYREEMEPYREVGARIKSEPLLILSQGLAVDAFASGRLGQWRFKLVDCPRGESWAAYLDSLKQESHWLMFAAGAPDYRFGPGFTSNLGPSCESITDADLRKELRAAGWSFDIQTPGGHQLWKATDAP